jgi:hypothetical protein
LRTTDPRRSANRDHLDDRRENQIPWQPARPGAKLPRLRALALSGRRPPKCEAPLSLPASENLHKCGSQFPDAIALGGSLPINVDNDTISVVCISGSSQTGGEAYVIADHRKGHRSVQCQIELHDSSDCVKAQKLEPRRSQSGTTCGCGPASLNRSRRGIRASEVDRIGKPLPCTKTAPGR